MLFRNYQFKSLNIRLIIYTLALTIIGILIIGSANPDSQKKQILGLVLSIIVMFGMALVDYDFLLQFHWVYYIVNTVLLVAVLFSGHGSHGAQRWLKIGITFQPSELAKILLVLFMAWFLTKHQDDLNTRKVLLSYAALCGIPLLLILKEPDLSTTIVTFMVLLTLICAAGLTRKIVVPFFSITVPAFFLYIIFVYQTKNTLLGSYQGERILAWLHPEDHPQKAYQQHNSIMAIGSGMLFGKGLNNDSSTSVKNGNFIPEPQTDFIFAVAGEELGFIGSAIIIILILLISYECIKTAKKANTLSGTLICVGMACIISFQSFVNICVVTGLMPNTGLTLPFVSYGLTSLLTLYFGIGVVLNVSLQEKRYR